MENDLNDGIPLNMPLTNEDADKSNQDESGNNDSIKNPFALSKFFTDLLNSKYSSIE